MEKANGRRVIFPQISLKINKSNILFTSLTEFLIVDSTNNSFKLPINKIKNINFILKSKKFDRALISVIGGIKIRYDLSNTNKSNNDILNFFTKILGSEKIRIY